MAGSLWRAIGAPAAFILESNDRIGGSRGSLEDPEPWAVKRGLQARAARHGRSVEAEARAILAEAVHEPADSVGLFTTLLDRFGALGGADLDLPGREASARAAEFSWPCLASPRSTRKTAPRDDA